MKIASASQMRELDRNAIEEFGIPGIVLMENAGKETVSILESVFKNLKKSSIHVVAGKGNNGGDGFVIARHLHNRGCDVNVMLMTKIESLTGDAGINARICLKMGIPIHEIDSDEQNNLLKRELDNTDLVIDALFGTGLARPALGRYKEIIDLINCSHASVVSVDIPSGLFADQPIIPGTVVKADITVTFGLAKPALILYPAADFCGQVFVVDISIPADLIETAQLPGSIISPYQVNEVFNSRQKYSHKGTYGHLLIIAGSPGKTGAAALAGSAAIRSGAGLVTIAVPDQLNSVLEVKLTEVMTEPIPCETGLNFDISSEKSLRKLMDGKTCILIGPGIGLNPETGRLIERLICTLDIPIVLDADALTHVAKCEGIWENKTAPLVLTPHPGEMARLYSRSKQMISNSQLDLIPKFAELNQCIVVYKTARTLIAFPDKSWVINICGNPGMATGGTGDVLSGMISGLIAQGTRLSLACNTGVLWHGIAGDIAAGSIGEKEMIAGDIINCLSQARRIINEKPERYSGNKIPVWNNSFSSGI